MFQKFIKTVLCLALVGPTVSSLDNKEEPMLTRTISFTRAVEKLIINGDADVVLTNSLNPVAIIKGRADRVMNMGMKEEDGELIINSREIYRGRKPVISIPAHTLQSLVMNGDGHLRSAGQLNTRQLNILINGTCDVAIFSKGKISIDSSPEFFLSYKIQQPAPAK